MKNDRKGNESGFSLIELTIVSVILVVVIGILATIVSNVNTSYANMRPRTEALNDATAALDMMTRLIRTAGNNPSNIAGLQRIDPGVTSGAPAAFRTIRLRSNWHGTAGNAAPYLCVAGTKDTVCPPDGDILDSFENVGFSVVNNTLMKQETPADATPQPFLNNVGGITFRYFNSTNGLIANPAADVNIVTRIEVNIVMRTPGSPDATFTSSAFLRQSY